MSGEGGDGRHGNLGSNGKDEFHRIPSESSIMRKNTTSEGGSTSKVNKPWERSQSALDLQNNMNMRSSSTTEYSSGQCDFHTNNYLHFVC